MRRVIQTVSRLSAGVGACLLIPLMLVTAIDVVGRDLFGHPIPGTIELSEFMLAVFILLGIPYTHQAKGFVQVSVFISRLPARTRSVFNLISTLLSLFIFSILAWQGLVVSRGVVNRGAHLQGITPARRARPGVVMRGVPTRASTRLRVLQQQFLPQRFAVHAPVFLERGAGDRGALVHEIGIAGVCRGARGQQGQPESGGPDADCDGCSERCAGQGAIPVDLFLKCA